MIRDLFGKQKKLYYIIENNWVIENEAKEIVPRLQKKYKMKAEITTSFEGVKNSLIHFGARHLFLPENFKKVHPSNRIVFTWYHGTDEDIRFTESLPEGSKIADFVHTSNDITLELLVKLGVDRNKIVKIPIGIDLNKFYPLPLNQKLALRQELEIPEDAFVIGSFQKDGNGWDEGNDPKLIKGPDIFCDVVERVYKIKPIYVFLTGPARGYIKNRLTSAGIPFKHIFLKDLEEVSKYYSVLDLYLVTSRVEGGPKAITESLASGVPLISTKVGMAPEVVRNNVNGFLTEVEDVDELVKRSLEIIDNLNLRQKFINNGLESVKRLSWDIIIDDYYHKIYSKLI